jgi:hypothetical protein
MKPNLRRLKRTFKKQNILEQRNHPSQSGSYGKKRASKRDHFQATSVAFQIKIIKTLFNHILLGLDVEH